MNLTSLLIQIIVGIIFIAPVFWLSGRPLAGKGKARFTDAIWIVVLGLIIGAVVDAFVGGSLGAVVLFVIWLALIKHFFDCRWLRAFAIALVAVIIFVVIVPVPALIGIGILKLLF